jgi:hypothetical protein
VGKGGWLEEALTQTPPQQPLLAASGMPGALATLQGADPRGWAGVPAQQRPARRKVPHSRSASRGAARRDHARGMRSEIDHAWNDTQTCRSGKF